MKHRKTFQEVLLNCDDQVAVRDILNMVLTEKQKWEVVTLFNIHADHRNEIRKMVSIND